MGVLTQEFDQPRGVVTVTRERYKNKIREQLFSQTYICETSSGLESAPSPLLTIGYCCTMDKQLI